MNFKTFISENCPLLNAVVEENPQLDSMRVGEALEFLSEHLEYNHWELPVNIPTQDWALALEKFLSEQAPQSPEDH